MASGGNASIRYLGMEEWQLQTAKMIYMTTHGMIFADAQRMDALADESVHLVVTSPPSAT